MKVNLAKLKGLALDSRKVKPGFLFAALPGSKSDGREFIAAAVENGATTILAPKGTNLPDEINNKATLILSDNPRRDFAKLAAEFYGAAPEFITAVTGTNGKTSVAYFAQQLWNANKKKAVSIGTLGIRGAGLDKDGALTTPDPITMHEILKDMAGGGVTHAALEASSHGLDQFRLDGAKLRAAAFTNLSRDHLDYHGTMEKYLAAKARLFTDLLEKGGTAVLNADIPEYKTLKTLCEKAGHKIISYGENGDDLKILEDTPTAHGQTLKLEIFGKPHTLDLPLVGDFQAHNVLCALGLVAAENPEEIENYVKCLPGLKGVPGRLEAVTGHPENAGVYVDYAHTPDALEHVLKALRPHTSGKLVCIMGCGGDRDKGKRSQMGGISCDLADEVIVTDDNPRSEDPSQIRAEILAACEDAREIGDRAEAIKEGLKILTKGDVLLIAGKGHESGQTIGDKTLPFNDVDKAKKLIEEMKHEFV